MERLVQPELLDRLPGDHPQAIRSHRDLRWIHAWMGNARLVARWLERAASREAPQRIIDLGAGDGAFLLRCLRRVPNLPRGTELVLMDRRDSVDPVVLTGLRDRGLSPRVERVDVRNGLSVCRVQAGTWILASLFLHHFETQALRALLALVAEHATLVCACEPSRAWFPLAACRLLPLIGASAVTHHDAAVSVRAGFRGRELTELWPAPSPWRLRERRAGLFSHLLVAERTTGCCSGSDLFRAADREWVERAGCIGSGGSEEPSHGT